MSDIPSDLEQLRRSIDEIDDRLQDLLIERIGVVSRIDAFKHESNGVAAHQPAREAEIIRRLIERNRGAFPPATLVRMWRELLAATVRQQSAFDQRTADRFNPVLVKHPRQARRMRSQATRTYVCRRDFQP